MVSVIEEKKKIFETECDRCGCKFVYEMVDIDWRKKIIVCPCCGEFVEHSARHNKISQKSIDYLKMSDFMLREKHNYY